MDATPTKTPERQAFYDAIETQNLAPLWESLTGLITPEPRSSCEAAMWRYRDVRERLMQAGDLITAKEAERRVLVLVNPGLPGTCKVTTSLYAGLQLILPGEVAPAHRHSQTALRFVVEGEGAYTSVDGERTIMNEGDFVITPSWTWHAHGKDTDGPMVWMDGLDIPIVTMLDSSFAEGYPDDEFPQSRPTGDALARYGSGLLPVDHEPARAASSPVFNYPYARTREALEQMRKTQEWDPCHGLKLKYVNPETGDFAIPTMGTFMQLLPKGFAGSRYRSTDAAIYSVVEGSGRTHINTPDGEQVFEWSKRDTIVVPSWQWHHHEADEDAVLFSFSDRAAQAKLGLWREDRGNA